MVRCYAVSGTDVAYPATRTPHAPLAYAAMLLAVPQHTLLCDVLHRPSLCCCAMFGTDLAYATPTQYAFQISYICCSALHVTDPAHTVCRRRPPTPGGWCSGGYLWKKSRCKPLN
eukprot:2367313-Rhodomonas_salina.4